MANNKTVKFTTKIFHDKKVYLRVSDVAKALNYPTKQSFVDAYKEIITRIRGTGDCVLETDYNSLLSMGFFLHFGYLYILRICSKLPNRLSKAK